MTEKEYHHDHVHVHDNDDDILITSVEGPSCARSTTGKQLNGYIAVTFKICYLCIAHQ